MKNFKPLTVAEQKEQYLKLLRLSFGASKSRIRAKHILNLEKSEAPLLIDCERFVVLGLLFRTVGLIYLLF